MAIVWVIEASKQPLSSAQFLMGDFPTRLFRSFESLKKLYKLKFTERPSIILVEGDEPASVEPILNFLREKFPLTPSILLSRRHFSNLKDAHFIEKPIDAIQLVRSIRIILDDTKENREMVVYQDIVLQMRKNYVQVGGEIADLTQREMRILECLIKYKGNCVSREQLVEEVWSGVHVSPRTVDSHISRIRKIIDHSQSLKLIGVYGKGYLLTSDDQ